MMDAKFSNGYTDHDDNNKSDAASELSPLKPIPEEPEYKLKAEEKRKLTLKEKIKLVKNNITVEPIMIAYIMPCVLASMATQNLNLEKACRVNLNYSSEICDALTLRQTENYTDVEIEVQKLIAGIQAWKNVIQTAIPFVIIQFVGAWSDKTGKRKICILLPIVGEFLTCIGFIVNTYFFYELPAEAAMLTEAIFPAITGGWYTNFLGAFSYISDITTKEERTFRIGVVNLCYSLGVPVGSALSGILLRWVGYYGVFSISASLYICSLIYGFYYLEDPNRKETTSKGVVGAIKEFFDINLTMETYRVVFKSGRNNRRIRVCLLLLVVGIIYGPWQGEMTVLYLFTRYRFNWDEVQYSFWSTYCVVTNLCGTLFSISLFTNYMKLDDSILAIISNMSKILACFAYAFARNNLEIYMAPLLDILNGSAFIAIRSIASKQVEPEEIGKINSVIGMAESSIPMLYGPLYSQVYMATMNVLPGAVFLLSSALTLPAVLIFGWLYYDQKKSLVKSGAKIEMDAANQDEVKCKP